MPSNTRNDEIPPFVDVFFFINNKLFKAVTLNTKSSVNVLICADCHGNLLDHSTIFRELFHSVRPICTHRNINNDNSNNNSNNNNNNSNNNRKNNNNSKKNNNSIISKKSG